MNKSLLELLQEENRLVNDVKYKEESASEFLECAYKDGYSYSTCRKIALDFQNAAIESKKKLLVVRQEIKKYLDFLATL